MSEAQTLVVAPSRVPGQASMADCPPPSLEHSGSLSRDPAIGMRNAQADHQPVDHLAEELVFVVGPIERVVDTEQAALF
jgi:hypothetical protein